MDDDAIYREFGRRVAMRRSELRITQGALAAAVGFSRASIANIETGRQKLPLHQVYRILTVLELDDVTVLLPQPAPMMQPEHHIPTVAMRGVDDLSTAAKAQIKAIYAGFGSGH